MTFQDLNLNKSLLNALTDIGVETPTAIQRKVFSPIMSGKDIVGIAQTGTGKTYAYLLPSLRLWKFSNSPFAQILVIVPTRELVSQVVEEVKNLTAYMSFTVVGVYGGANIRYQIEDVEAGTDMIVGTPGRLLDLILKGAFKTKNLKRLIIDEVDEMLNLGFRTQLNTILEFLPKKRQNLMFSATMPDEVEDIINNYSDYFEKIETAPSGAPLENIEQSYYPLENFLSKASLLKRLLDDQADMSRVLVFVKSKKMADALYEKLAEDFPESMRVIHSSKSQNHRFESVKLFQSGELRVLIATDIIARGLDVSMVTHVVNYDLPEIAERYIHRIGRTGRAEQKGIAMSFISTKDESYKNAIETLMDLEINLRALPEELETTEELIDIETEPEFVPFNNHKRKEYKPTGDAFHEKLDKNKKENKKRNYEQEMKKKYKKQYRPKDRR